MRTKEVHVLRKLFGVLFVTVMVMVGAALPSAAAFDYTNTFTPVSTELQVALTAIVPIVLIVFAIILGIRLGMSLVRRVAGR
jgi:hypothetical protein